MTLTVRIPDETEARLHERVSRDELALSEFVLQAIAEKLEREPKLPKRTAYEVWQECFTGESSGKTDVAERAEEVLRAKFDAKRRGGQ